MDIEVRGRRIVAILATIAAALMLLILAMSATIRLAHQSCANVATSSAIITVARIIHRICAMSISVVLIAIAFFGLRLRPVPFGRIARIGILFLLTVFLAVLGRASSGNSAPGIPLFNVVAGMIMLALFWLLRLEFTTATLYSQNGARQILLARVAGALVALQIWLGAWIAGLTATLDCTMAPVVQKIVWWPNPAAWQALDILHTPVVSAVAVFDAIAWLLLLHKIGAAMLFAAALALGIELLRSERNLRGTAYTMWMLLAIQIVLGLIAVGIGQSLWLGVAHNAIAALLLAALVGIRYQLLRANHGAGRRLT